MTNLSKPYKMLSHLVLFLALPLANGRLSGRRVVDRKKTRKLLADSGELINVVVGYTDTAFTEQAGSTFTSFRSIVQTQYKRTNAVAMAITLEEWSELEQDPTVTYIEKDSMVYPQSNGEEIPWGIGAVQGNSTDIPLPDIENDCFKVCVIDSGLMVSHPDIPYSLGSSKIQGRAFGLPEGQFWHNPGPGSSHGTHVTGSIIAAGDNDIGVVGVISNNQNICMLQARVFSDEQGEGQSGSVIDSAAEWCADKGARVINMSLGSGENSKASKQIYERIAEEGVLVIGASGNGGTDDLLYPASYEDVISVSAVNVTMQRANFSQYNSEVDITAPGEDIVSTVPGITVTDNSEDSYSASIMEYAQPPPTDVVSAELVDCGLGTSPCQGVAGKICYMERGLITFLEKARNCFQAGGIMALVYNNVNGTFAGTLGEPSEVTIPVLALSHDEGLLLQSKLQKPNTIYWSEEAKLKALEAQEVIIEANFNAPTYESQSGTSMAAPHVAGVATKIWAARPECTSTQVRNALLETAIDLGEEGRDDQFGHGLVQAVKAYEYLLGLPEPCGLASNDAQTSPDFKAHDLIVSSPEFKAHDIVVSVRTNPPCHRQWCGR